MSVGTAKGPVDGLRLHTLFGWVLVQIEKLCAALGLSTDEVIAFGDDFADIGMLQLCGRGIAMGNAIDEVKQKADFVIGGNDEEGIAEYLKRLL